MRPAILLAAPLALALACGQREEEPAPSVVPVTEEPPAGAAPQPLGAGGTVTVAGAETVAAAAAETGAEAETEAAAETAAETEAEAEAGAETEAGASGEAEGPRVRITHAVCGDRAVRGGTGDLRLGSRRGDRGLRVQIRDLGYYCSPAPRFSARIAGDTLELRVLAPPPGTPVARCVCPHDADLTIDEVPEDVTTIALLSHHDGAVVLESPVGHPLGAGSRERR